MKTRIGKNDEGIALLVSIIFLVMMGILAAWATARVMGNARNVDKYADYSDAFQGVEAGMAAADRKSTRLNSSHIQKSRMPSSA